MRELTFLIFCEGVESLSFCFLSFFSFLFFFWLSFVAFSLSFFFFPFDFFVRSLPGFIPNRMVSSSVSVALESIAYNTGRNHAIL